MKSYDVLVIGGGMAGVSLGYELAADRTVGLLEMESTLAFHTTGRSAATFLETYGGPEIRALTTASRSFYENPPDTFESLPLTPLPMLLVAPEGRGSAIRELQAAVVDLVPDVRLLAADEVLEINPVLRPGYAELGMLEPGAKEIDVHCVHQGYTRGLRERGGTVLTSAGIAGAVREHGVWTVTDRAGEQHRAPVIVNAAGSWADEVAEVVGARELGIMPLRRSIFLLGAPDGLDTATLPMTCDVDATYYIKPEGRQFLCSPAEETPQPPGDARADELEIARALDVIHESTTLTTRHVRSSWAGLRNFVPDRIPVVGFDGSTEGLFWFAGQGGYGIQTAPALARTAAALVRGQELPADVGERGLTAGMLSPTRPNLAVPAEH